MTQHRDLAYGQRLPESWVDAIQEFISVYASPNFLISLENPTTLAVDADTDNDQVSIGINGRWRYNTATVTAAHPGGGAGTYDVYVTGSDNDFDAGDPETDNTVYAFGLVIRATASPPATALYRKVATIAWSGTAITSISPIIGFGISSGYITSTMIQDGTIQIVDLGFDPATQAELDVASAALAAHIALTTSAHGGIVASSDARLTNSRTPTGAAGSDIGGTYPSSVTVLQASTTFGLTGTLTPSDISASQNNYDPSGLSTHTVLRLNPTAAVNLTGLAGGADGRILVLRNVSGTFSVTLTREDASSTAANRFTEAAVIRPKGSVVVQYDSTLARWVLWGRGGGTLPAFVGAILAYSGSTALATNTEINVPWSSEVKDSDGFHTGSNNYITVPSGLDGVYAIDAQAWGDVKTDAWIAVRVNGVVVAATSGVAGPGDYPVTGGPKLALRTGIVALDLAQGDVVDVRVKSPPSGNATTITSARLSVMQVAS